MALTREHIEQMRKLIQAERPISQRQTLHADTVDDLCAMALAHLEETKNRPSGDPILPGWLTSAPPSREAVLPQVPMDADMHRAYQAAAAQEFAEAPSAEIPKRGTNDVASTREAVLEALKNMPIEEIARVSHTQWQACAMTRKHAALLVQTILGSNGTDDACQSVPEGYVLVPKVPTYEMVQAGAKLVKDNLPWHTGTKAIYETMIAASVQKADFVNPIAVQKGGNVNLPAAPDAGEGKI